MIYRQDEDGWLVITQGAHAWMAGELAANWGNSLFALPRPREAVVLATRLHDAGWAQWDALPRLNRHGEPASFLETTFEETTSIWQAGVRLVAQLSPYAGLLVSQHATTIFQRRLERGADPQEKSALIRQQLELQEKFRAALSTQLTSHPEYGSLLAPERLLAAYRWLRTCDLLSLALLTEALPEEGQIQKVPGSDLGLFTTIRYRRVNATVLEVAPWPFEVPSLEIGVDVRRIERQEFPNQAALVAELEEAPWIRWDVGLRSP